MSTAPHLSDYIIAAIVAGLAATTFSESLLGSTSSGIPLDHVRGSVIAPSSNGDVAAVDRLRKGDRAPLWGVPAGEPAALRPVTNTTIVRKNIVAPQFNGRETIDTPVPQKVIEIDDGKPIPALPEGCEALASSIADPTLSRLIGRCLA